jgi:GAF domain-containing protein
MVVPTAMNPTAASDPSGASPPTSGLDSVLALLAGRVLALLAADRCTIFIYDRFSNTLWSRVATGAEVKVIRIPSGAGLAGECFTTGGVINIPDAYADPRFNREIDQRTGYRTHTVLCVPMLRPDGTKAGVIQVLNKHAGPFDPRDEELAGVFCDQAAITIQSAIAQDALESSRIKERRLTQELTANHGQLEQAFADLSAQKEKLEKVISRQHLIYGAVLGLLGLALAVLAVVHFRRH